MAPCSPGSSRASFLERSLARLRARALRKPPLSLYTTKHSDTSSSSLKKVLNAFDLTFMGIGGIIGAGVFVLTGTAARQEAGPAVVVSYLMASFAALLSAFSYAEFAVDLRVAGGAYVYANLVFGELTGWISATSLASEYILSAAAIARAFTSYFGSLVHGDADIFRIKTGSRYCLIDIPALLVVLTLCGVLAAGTQSGARFNTIVTVGNLAVIAFVLATGLPHLKPTHFVPFMPMGVRGAFSGASKVFFSFLGFETVASAAEETRNPPVDLPIGIIAALAACAGLYALMCVTIVGMVPWNAIDIDTPFSAAYSQIGWPWAGKVVALGAILGIVTSLLMSLFGQIRLLMCLGRERMLPAQVGVVSDRTDTPLVATLIAAIASGSFALLLDLEVLAELVSVGSLVCFLLVNAACVWRRYALPVSGDHSPGPGQNDNHATEEFPYSTGLAAAMEKSEGQRLEKQQPAHKSNWTLAIKMLLLMTTSIALSGAYVANASDWAVALLAGCWLATALSLYIQPVTWQAASFRCPCSPFFPCLGILTNVFLITSLGATAYVRFGVWLLISVLFYVFYSVHNSPATPSSYNRVQHLELTDNHADVQAHSRTAQLQEL